MPGASSLNSLHTPQGERLDMQQDDQGGQVIKVKCAPVEWPLFSAPGLSSMRVVDYKEKGGILVSLHSSHDSM